MTLTTLLLSEPDRKITYRVHGAGDPLVLIHGVGMQSAAWGPQIAHLADQCCVIAIDMPGHGGSDPLPTHSQLADYVEWCRNVLVALGLGPVNVAGHSMGALIAAGLAVTHPHLVRRVALLNGVFERGETAKIAVKARAAEIHQGEIDIQTPLTRWFDDHQQEARAQVAAWLGSVDLGGYATAYTAFANGDATYASQFSNIKCPFLAMTGDGDPNSTPDMAQIMADLVQDGQSAVIKGHRHMINLTAPDQVNAQLSIWLNRPLRTQDMS